jgi:hypothetical protein
MTEAQVELAKRAVACKGFRWMPGMRGWKLNNHGVPFSIRFVEGVESMGALAGVGAGKHIPSGYATCDGDWRAEEITPDLSDPATLGCLLFLVREVWGNPCIGVRGWLDDEGGDDLYEYYEVMGLDDELTADTEAEALVAALEGAP